MLVIDFLGGFRSKPFSHFDLIMYSMIKLNIEDSFLIILMEGYYNLEISLVVKFFLSQIFLGHE